MNAIALAVLAAAVSPAQPLPPAGLPGSAPVAPTPAVAPASDVRFVSKRTLNVPVNFRPERLKELREALLFVCRDGANLYEIGDRIDPSKTAEFNYLAKEDGEYWVQLQLVYKDGTLEPKDPSKLPPAEKVVIDTVKPVVVITSAEMSGDEAVVEWRIDDKHPADANTRVWYKQTGGGDSAWQEVPAASISKRTARFKPAVAGPLTVQVTTADLARNIGHMNKDVKGPITTAGGTTPSPTPLAPAAPGGFDPGPASPGAIAPPKDPFTASGGGPLPAVNFGPEPPAARPPAPPAPTFTPTPPASPTFTAAQPTEVLKPIATSTAPVAPTAPVPAGVPPVEAPAAQFSRTPRFELNYTLDSGASGVARVDLYVSRDDGRSWVRWSQHDGRETPLKVVLDTRFNKEVEGDYGFVLVPVSGAGLSEGAPTANTAPELKVRVDTTAPVIKVYAPTADPNNKAALMLNWEATDKNLGRDPVAIEYAESPQGPWKSVTGTDGPAATRIENTGSYSWQPPLNLATPKVYLRFAAWDLAGNKSEVVTPQPILVDLTKPKARIQGISGGK
jgi:hypothetical protein